MNSKIAVVVGLSTVLAVMLVPVSFSPAFAADVAVTITPGSTSKTTDAFAPNPANAQVGDKVTWTNKDSTPHTVVSGSGGKPDGKFDSSPNFNPLIQAGGSFSVMFNQTGDYPYYCALHPNMIGTVTVGGGGGGGPMTVTVTAKTADGKSFDITSSSTTSTATIVKINEGKSVTITFDKAGEVELKLPKAMISGNLTIMAGTTVVQSTPTENSDSTTLKFTLPAGTTTIDITGTTVVPEFPVIATLVLVVSIAAIIGYTRFARNEIGLF